MRAERTGWVGSWLPVAIDAERGEHQDEECPDTHACTTRNTDETAAPKANKSRRLANTHTRQGCVTCDLEGACDLAVGVDVALETRGVRVRDGISC